MYKIKEIVYSEAGKILVGKNMRGYAFEGEPEEFMERDITLDDVVIEDNFVRYGGVVQSLGDDVTYAGQKAAMVKRRYSLDDQIAIMLNKDDDADSALAYAKMQEWREWSGRVAKAILAALNKEVED